MADRETAVREVAEVYEHIKVQLPLLLHSQPPPPSPSTTTHQQLAQSLLGEALRALNVALSVMKQQQPAAAPVTPIRVVVKAEPHHQLSPPSPAPSADSQAAMAPRRSAKRRRSSSVAMEGKKRTSSSSSWSTVTAVPHDDGYEWRKYGEKKINGTRFTRSYFRCTYKDDAGCLATKHVQQTDNNSDNPPMFHVIYNNDHTCNNRAKASAIANMKQEPTGHQHATAAAAMNMKQEPRLVLLPALVDLQQQPSACFPDDQIPRCQEPVFPVSMDEKKQFCGALRDDDGEIPSATGSCISGETSCWDGYYSGDMAAAQDPLHDLERFLFMDY